jgi:hypothetical protein
MIKQFDQIFQEDMLTEQGEHRQSQSVTRYSNQGFHGILKAIRGVFVKIAAAQERAPQQVAAVATRRWNKFVSHGLVAPEERASLSYHAPEKVHVFPGGVELASERSFAGIQDATPEEHVARASFLPVHAITCFVGWPVEEFSFRHPCGRFGFKVRLNRPKPSGNFPLYAGFV